MARKYTDDEVRSALHYDPLAEAERVVGSHWSEDKSVGLLGLNLAARSSDAKAHMLASRQDVHSRMTLAEYEATLPGIGFARVLDVPFLSPSGKTEERLTFWVDAQRAILLKYDTYSSQTVVNGGKFYYNVRANGGRFDPYTTSSGHWTKSGVWVGDHDCRQAVRFAIEEFERQGEFVNPWIEKPSIYPFHHGEERDRNTPLNREYFEAMRVREMDRLRMLPVEFHAMFLLGE